MQNETHNKEVASELLNPVKKYRDLMVFAPKRFLREYD